MSIISKIYKTNLSLLTDFYQLTMAYAYFKTNRLNDTAVFHVYFRNNPFGNGYTVAAGLEFIIDYLSQFKFSEEDISYLESLENENGTKIFDEDFFYYLKNLKFSCSVKAVPEGTVVFPYEPILQISGPILQCQLFETPILNFINFNSLIATKASRIKEITGPDPILEFGLRRAHGIDGALSASRAAFIGGTNATSNTLAGKTFGIPVKGTHSHSWVMSFNDEEESFLEFAKVLPDFTIFLVDTYDTIEGVKKAINVGRILKSQGKKLIGVRLDSGDLAYLSIEARKLLDKAGFTDTQIFASNDLNEKIISSLKTQGAKIGIWGVGTQLITAYDQPALGGVYKLTALKNNNSDSFEHRIKISEQAVKTSTPGILQVRRYSSKGQFIADMIFDELTPIQQEPLEIIDPTDPTRFRSLDNNLTAENLLIPIFENGVCVYKPPTLLDIQAHTLKQVSSLHPGIKRLDNPHHFPAGIERHLHNSKMKLILEKKKKK